MNKFMNLLCRPVMPALTGLLLGIYAASQNMSRTGFLIAAAALYAAGAASVILSSGPGRRRLVFMCIWTLFPLFTAVGYLRYAEARYESPLKKALYKSTEAKVYGTIDYISVREGSYSITLTDSFALIGADFLDSDSIKLEIDTELINEPSCGMCLCASGVLYPFETPGNPGQFDSDMYYRIRGTDARMYVQCAEILGRIGGVYAVRQTLYRVRSAFSRALFAVLPEKEAGSLTAMLTGDRGMLDSELKELYAEGGIAHILSISSLHISLLGMGLFRLLMKVTGRLKASSAATVIFMILYAVLTGGSVSVRRAVIMVAVSLAAGVLPRPYDMPSSVGVSALVILSAQPLYLFDSGFLMSYTAAAGVCTARTVIDCRKIKSASAGALISSLCVWLCMVPVIINSYYYLNPYSVFINTLIIPFMSVVLVSGLLAGGIALAAVKAGVVFAAPAYYILKGYEFICGLEGRIPGSILYTGHMTKTAVVVYYALYAASAAILMSERNKRKSVLTACIGAVPALASVVLVSFLTLRVRPGCLMLHFMDVGQGDAILVRTHDCVFMVDAGSSSVSKAGEYRIEPVLKYYGISSLDAIIATHEDSDHINGFTEMLESGYPAIETVYISPFFEGKLAAAGGKAEIRYIAAGSLLFDGMARCVSPALTGEYEDKNAASIVLEASVGEFSMLLAGDSDFAAEDLYVPMLDKNVRGGVDVLKCAHHGSKYSTSETMLAAVHPAVTVISCDRYNSYGHPNPLLLSRLSAVGSDIYITPDCGCITVVYEGGDEYYVRTYRESQK